MFKAWIPASAGILCIVLFQLPPLVNCLRARDTQKQISSQDKKFRQCRLFHSNHWEWRTKHKIMSVSAVLLSALLYFPYHLKLHTVFRVPTSAAFSETVVRTGSQDEKWEHQCLCDWDFGELELISALMFAFAWNISIYQTIKSVIFLLFLLGEMLAKECLNEIPRKFLPFPTW